MFTRLNDEQISRKIKFISTYISQGKNAAESSSFDPNANVTSKNISTLESELYKDFSIQINRRLVYDKIKTIFNEDIANQYIRDIESHIIYVHDETTIKPYCVSVSMYPFLLNGLKDFGCDTSAPTSLASFCGNFINLVFTIASQFAGAVATVEFLMYFDYFASKTLGANYLETNEKVIISHFKQIIYSINHPTASRGYQSVFWNISIYDKQYFSSMFENFFFPNGSRPNWESVNKLQKFFMKWFNKENSRALLTYPVITAACLTKDGEFVDLEFKDFLCQELSDGNSFFIFINENAHALSSCCRLKNNIENQINEFSYTLGAGGVSTGSVNVITININRITQKNINLRELVRNVHKYQYAHMVVAQEYGEAGMLPAYKAGYISFDKQYLTIGVNGIVEAAEYLGIEPNLNERYMSFVKDILKSISDENKIANISYGFKFNTEFTPAENLGIKNAKWDKENGLMSKRDCYNSYLYRTEDDDISILDKFRLHGNACMKYLDGGSAYHCNLQEIPTKKTFEKLLTVAAKEGCEYFCFNIRSTVCNDCNHIERRTTKKCIKCGSEKIEYATRIIGYLKKISNFSCGRQIEHSTRHYS